MAKNLETLLSLNDLELTNNDLFVRKNLTSFDRKAQILVYPTHTAILIKDGILVNTLDEGRHDIFDKKEDKDVREVEVVYMSKTAKLQALWGTRTKMNMRDPVTGTRVEVGVNGEYEVQIRNPRQFYLELVGADKMFTLETLKERLLGRILNNVEPICARYMKENNLSYVDFAENRIMVADLVRDNIKQMFEREYGLNLFSFTISNCYIPDNYIKEIETILKDKKDKEEFKQERQEAMSEIERLSDKKFDQTIILKQFEQKNNTVQPQEKKEEPKFFCTKCGNEYTLGDAFCAKCGNKLAKPTINCPKCGKVNNGENCFCSGCGTKLQ